MKNPNVIGFAAAALVIVAFLLYPAITLELAKRETIRKFSSPDMRVLNCVPSPSILSIPHLDPAASYLVAELHGCEVGLPDSEFQRDIIHKNVFTNDNLRVVCFGTLDKTSYAEFEQALHITNTFELISNTYWA
ncbi:MAG TPA: hypothetical protein VK815_13315, partial [Candidatus Acidoferrales bacterium]|nr:hypothetical protein [Candidatus Acidoferrales bacterium]